VASPAIAMAEPDTAITAGPIGRTSDSSPSFAFASSDPAATFECSLDGRAFTPCASPTSYAGVTESPHTFAVRAIDVSGAADPSPAQRSFVADASVDATVSAARSQHPAERVEVAVRVDSDEGLSVVAKGTVRIEERSFELRRQQLRARRGRTIFRLVPQARSASAVIDAALRRGESAKANVSVVLVDRLANLVRAPVTARLSAP
jgi:hypothetical protein